MQPNTLFYSNNGVVNANQGINGHSTIHRLGVEKNPKQTAHNLLKQLVQPASDTPASIRQGNLRTRSAPRIKHPLVIVGAGGTGRWIVTFIKAILLQTFGAIPANVALIAFDSGAEVVNTRSHNGQMVQLEDGSEFLSLGKVPIAGIKRNPTYHGALAQRLGDAMYKIYRQSIVDGCSQMRIEGMTTLYYHFDSVFSTLQRAIHRVTERNNEVETSSEDAQKINIVLIGSTGGGQGSGILLDLGLLVRELLNAQGGWEDTAQVTGFFALPSAFNDVKERDKRNMAPNTVAFLRELEMLQGGERVEIQYPNRVAVRNMDAPFDHVYVLEGIDERGYLWSSQRDVDQMVARGITLLTAGHVGMSEMAFSLNQQGVLMHTSAGGYRSYLAALGLSELYYPGDRVVQVALLRHIHAMLSTALQPQASAEGLPELPEAPSLTRAQLLAQLQQGAGATAHIQLPGDLREDKVEQMPAKVRDYVGRFKQRRIYELCFPQLQVHAAKVSEQTSESYRRWVERISYVSSLPLLQQMVRLCLRQLTEVANELQQAQKELSAEMEHKRREVTAADTALVQAAESFMLGRKARTLNAVDHFVDEAEQMVQLEVRERQLALAETVVRTLLQQLEEVLATIEATQLRLAVLAERVQGEEKRLLNTPMSQNVINLADDELITALYQQHAPVVTNSLQGVLMQGGGWLALNQRADDALLQALRETAAPAFETLATLDVENVLQQRWPDRSVDGWVNLLIEKAAVAWNVDRAKLPPGAESLASFLTLGVPDGDHSIFNKSGHTCTSTGDPQRIIVLRTVYGGSIDALKSLSRWEVEYQAALKGGLSVHLFPNLEMNRERVLTLLGLGLLFEFLRRKQAWFYYQPADALSKPQQVAQGLEKTVETLAGDGRFLEELEQRINAKIAEIGKTQAAHLLERWVEEQHERDDELFVLVLRAVRSFAEGLK